MCVVDVVGVHWTVILLQHQDYVLCLTELQSRGVLLIVHIALELFVLSLRLIRERAADDKQRIANAEALIISV